MPNLCACGCGGETHFAYCRGHNRRTAGTLTDAQKEQSRAGQATYFKARTEQLVSTHGEKAVKDKRKDITDKHHYRTKYGISLKEGRTLLSRVCAICGADGTTSRGRIGIDHDHSTGKVRDALCNYCNLVLGFAEDDIDRLIDCAEYLRAYRGETCEY